MRPTITAADIARYEDAATAYDRLSQLAYDLETRQWEIRDELAAIAAQLPTVNAELDAAWTALVAANGGENPTYAPERSMTE
jgi:hypothetical protein